MSFLTTLDSWPDLVIQMFLRGSLLLLLAGAATKLLARAPAAKRHLIWAVSLAGLLLLPAAMALGPRLPLPVLPSSVQVEQIPSPGEEISQGHADSTAVGPGRGVSPPASGSKSGLSLSSIFLLALVSLTAALLVYLSLGLIRVWRLCRQAIPLNEHPDWQPMLRDLRRRVGVRRQIDLRISGSIAVPSTWGIGRPSILLPEEAASWSRHRRRDCLLHELAHIRRLDWISHMLGRLACALHWFNPLVWWASRQLHLEAERACDDTVLLEGSPAPEYAEQLLEIARRARRETASVAFVSMAMPARLATRIHFILNQAQRRTTMKRIQVLVTSFAALLLVLAAGGLRLVEAAPDRDRQDGRGTRRISSEATPLMRAAAAGNETELRRLLAGGANPDQGVRGLGSPLILAAETGNTSVVRILLDAGADPRQFETGGNRGTLPRSALAAAAQAGRMEVVEMLLAAGARIDATPQGDATALMYAAAEGHGDLVIRLLAAGADARAEVHGDGTPLISAARAGRPEIVRTLLAAGADPDAGVRGDGSPLIAAARRGDLTTAELLLRAGASPDRAVDGDESPLYHAVRAGHTEMVELLLRQGADVNQALEGDGTALMQAAESGDDEMVDRLLAAGADPDGFSMGDGNALIQAARNGNRRAVERLVKAGADVNAGVRGDGNPIIMAAAAGHLDIVEYLVENGARVDQVVPGDENALIRASGHGHLDIVSYLVDDAGADVNIRVRTDREVRTALSMALRSGNDDVAGFLRSRGAVD